MHGVLLSAVMVCALVSESEGGAAKAVLRTLSQPHVDVTWSSLESDAGQQARRRIKRRPARRPVRRPPPSERRVRTSDASPLKVGLYGAGGAAIGTAVGLTGLGFAGAFATQAAGPQPPEVVLATTALGIGVLVTLPFLTGFGGGAGVLLADTRSEPDEWQGLLQCTTGGYCAGLASVGAPLLGGMACAPQGQSPGLPSPDRPAEWTAGAAIVGLVGGGVVGAVSGYTLASDRSQPAVPLGIGAFTGALLGSALVAGVGGGVATMTRP
jgi:hypothetical protein